MLFLLSVGFVKCEPFTADSVYNSVSARCVVCQMRCFPLWILHLSEEVSVQWIGDFVLSDHSFVCIMNFEI